MSESVSREPVAIVGVGCVLPDAPDVPTFWANLLAGRNSVGEVPKGRWDPALFWSADKAAPDKTYAKIGAFVADDAFNPLDYRMPPTVVQQIDPSQRWALAATRQALKDAGLKTGIKGDETGSDGKPLRDFDRTRTAVILGNAMGGELMKLHTKRLYWPQVEAALRADAGFRRLSAAEQQAMLTGSETAFKADVPPITEDSMPGTLSNVAAGRIANVFDLSGKNFTTDAACASSLAALDAAVDCLRKDECDLVVWGGTDRSMDITPYVEFSKIGALSPDGSRPFDASANGFVMGEGCAIFLLKRLTDAERDGDRIYAVVRGVGASSDGKGKGITAPNPVGQVKAVTRAYLDAEVDPATIGYLEAHGTSTPVGDPVELQSVAEAFRALTKTPVPVGAIAVGSVKSNMGHLKSAAGAVGLLKAALALRNGVIPPSINVRTLNPRIDWATAPFKVQTTQAQWPRPADRPRRAAVSSFGFGGTNFHVVLEEHVPGRLKASKKAQPMTSLDLGAFTSAMEANIGLEAEPVVMDAAQAPALLAALPTSVAYAKTGKGARVRDVLAPLTTAGTQAGIRVAFNVASLEDVGKKLEQAQKAATNPAQARLAFQQGVFMHKGKPQGKVAFLFPGQGTQYVNMLRDLAQKYEVVRNTFVEADQVLMDELDGVKLTDILWPTPNTPEAQAASEKKLQLTEFTQPAVLAADVALLRLLRQWGVEPDVVAGHSLGEYGALVAAGVLSFGDALHAVAARGREMAHVEVPDLGKMASVSADWQSVTSAIASVKEYVIPANKNCPSQTVIAGSSKGVDEAVALLQSKGLQCQMLPVSAAFHSAIVAPASKPLRTVLARLGVKSPKVRVLSNVGAQPYQENVDWILDNLATQVASPVEWIGIVERMYQEGVRTFIEVGPKLALTNFVRDILKEKPEAVAIGSNHPKKGGVTHVNELFAFLGAWGFQPKLPGLDDPAVYTATHRDPAAAFLRAPAQNAPAHQENAALERRVDELARMFDELRASVSGGRAAPTPQVLPPTVAAPAPASGSSAGEQALRQRMAAFGINLDDIGISGISVGLPGRGKPLFASDDWDRILRGDNLIEPVPTDVRKAIADKNIVRLVKGPGGSAQFEAVSDIAHVIKLAAQRGQFDLKEWGVEQELIDSLDVTFQYAIAAGLEALHDAGIPLQRTYVQTSTGGFLPKEWKLPVPLRDATGVIFASAFPGYDNLVRDISRYLADRYAGKTRQEVEQLYRDLIAQVGDAATKSRLQKAFESDFAHLRDTTGTAHYEFSRKFLFNVLSMGHSQLAQFIGARGPNTQVNAACASTTQAIGIAEDWIRTGRCTRVLVVAADDITNPQMFEWFGSGFLAAGAATTEADVHKAALPFDRRRHGMIVGMGAVGLLVETVPETRTRGMQPIARLLATRVANSAFHGSRLDVDHIAQEMVAMMQAAEKRYGVRAADIAPKTLFMSHETYTPARGGSAAAEIHALRAAFGPRANQVVVANTKGFTGHPQGASIEDAIALKCLQRGQVPPIANLKEPDPELGDLNLSRGGSYDVRYAVRLAAGFGSQVAMCLTELVARENERMPEPLVYARWLSSISGQSNAQVEVKNRTLRIIDQGAPKAAAKAAAPVAAPAPVQVAVVAQGAPRAPPASTPVVAPSPAQGADVLQRLIALVAEKTGYPLELLDPDQDMEADLGIDTVKQAELFGAIREAYALPPEDGIQIKDYPTLRKVAGYVTDRLGGSGAAHHVSAPPATTAAAVQVEARSPHPEAISSEGLPLPPSHSLDHPAPTGAHPDVLHKLIALVAEKTGYPVDLLDPDQDMEADLGIDTVKQAELFGAIREAYALPPEDGIQIKDYPSLRKVAGYVSSRLGSGARTQSAAQPAARSSPATVTNGPQAPRMPRTDATGASMQTVSSSSTSPAQPAVGGTPLASQPASQAAGTMPAPGIAPSNDILQKVIQLVAAKTGYPVEMLEPDQDMEADLGIDTVKQAELIGEVRATFGIPPMEGMQLKDYPTLRKVAGFVQANLPGNGHTGAPPSASPASSAGNPGSLLGHVPPSHAPPVVQVREVPVIPSENKPKGRTVVLEDDHPFLAEVSKPAAQIAEEAVAPPKHLPEFPTAEATTIVRRIPALRAEALPNTTNVLKAGTVLVVGDSDTQYVEALAKAGWHPTYREKDGVVGIVALATRKGTAALERSLALFDAAKKHRERLGKEAFVLVVTAQDGAHGLSQVRDASMAAVAGLGKSLRKELPDALVKVIDVHPDFRGAPAAVVEELQRGGPRTEVAYDAAGKRNVVDVVAEGLPDNVPDVRGKVLLVTGGAQGITVEMLAALAPQKPKLALLGRTDMPLEAPRWATWGEADWKKAEAEAIAEIKGRGEKPTPVAVQKAVAPMRKAADVHRNLERLRKQGAQVLYQSVDVTNPAAVKAAVERVHSEWGQPVEGILHAAGVEVSKDLASKDRDQFIQVFGPKGIGWDAVLAAVPKDKLQVLAGFGSVAGRFGNVGQVDYAAANEYLAKAIKLEAQKRKVPVAFTIAWGPWGEVGMATRGSILKIMETSGVTPIPTAEGVAMFLREMAQPGIRESVVAGALGAIDVDHQVVASPAATNGSAVRGKPAGATVTTTVTPAASPAGAQGARVVPPGGSAGTTMAAVVQVPEPLRTRPQEFRLLESVVAYEPGKSLVAQVRMDQARDAYARDHRVEGVPYLPGVFGLEAFAEASRVLAPQSQELVTAFDVQFASPLKQLKASPANATLTATVTASHNGTTEVLCRLTSQFVGPDGRAHGEPRTHFQARVMYGTRATGPKAGTPPVCTQDKVQSGIYPPFFHGPSFQVLRSAGPLDVPAVALYRHPVEPHFGAGPAAFQSHPLLLEALFQVSGLRTLVQERAMSLPAALERVEYYHSGPLPDQVTLVATPVGRDAAGQRLFDAQAIGPDGRVLMRMQKFAMVQTSPPPSATPTAPAAPSPTGTAAPTPAKAPPIPEAEVPLPDIEDVVFSAAAAPEQSAEPHWFTAREIDTHKGFKVPKRAAEWRAGRLAAKAAVLTADPALAALDVEVEGDPETRAPKLRVRGKETALAVSITHRAGLAIAAVSPQPLGIDLEVIEDRPKSFLDDVLSPAEHGIVMKAADPKVDVTCIWAAKEAVLKRVGIGLKADLRAHTVRADDHGGAVVEGPTGRFGVRFFEVNGQVLAVSLPAFDG